ncbi:hypothetical protein [Microbacterium galbinum]|uniref:hypothetical protein n=1 Tax=Microbacterium galbinum TaxID=2851646 RepID=UPI002001185B|nr:hypothetical protein [Microbacterium galbinum]
MGGVMAEEGDLREDDRERGGREELPPRLSDPDERREARGDDQWRGDELRPVVPVSAAQQALVADLLRQLGERARRARGALARTGADGLADVVHDDLLLRRRR